jgi:nucleotide sugar dehydrogenase
MESTNMSQSVFHAKPEEMDTAEKRGKYIVSIIGCGQIGVLHACLFAEAGFKVICVDANQTVVNSLAKGKAPFLGYEAESNLKTYVKTGRLNATNEINDAVSQSDIIAIAVPVKIDQKKKADYSEIENACKRVGSSLRRGSLVIVISTGGFDFTEGVVKEILENNSGLKVGADFGLAYSPIRASDAQSLEFLANHERIVAAPEKNSLDSASTILETIAKKNVRKVENVKSAELAILLGTVQRDVNVALTNEFALFCEKAGVDYLEANKLFNDGAYGTALLPTLTEDNTREEAYLLLEDAENLNMKLRVPKIAREINEAMIRHVVNLSQNALRDCGKTLRRARIALLGIAQTTNMKSHPKTAAKELVTMLNAKGAKVSVHDPYFSDKELTEVPCPFKRNLTEILEGADCAIILTGHDQFKRLNLKKSKVIMKMPAAIVDLEGITEPEKVEKEGFIYRGLGRGVWKK